MASAAAGAGWRRTGVIRLLAGAALLLAATGAGGRAAEPIKIALLLDRSAPSLEAAQSEEGFRLGLAYGTGGALRLRGRPIVASVADDGGDPESARRLAAQAYDDGAIAVITASSPAAASALVPLAAARRRPLLIADREDAAGAAARPGRYLFRLGATAEATALAAAHAFGRAELNLAAIAPDDAAGHGAAEALEAALARLGQGSYFAGTTFLAPAGGDAGKKAAALFDALHDLHGAKTLLVLWPAGAPPLDAILAADPGRYGIRLALAGPPPAQPRAGAPVELEGLASYAPRLLRNPASDWLMAHWPAGSPAPPGEAAARGMASALSILAGLRKAARADAAGLAAAMAGLRVATPFGALRFGRASHRAVPPLLHYRLTLAPEGGPPVLIRKLSTAESP
jgi:branched-chain amino acid transport system substrate-binding protein